VSTQPTTASHPGQIRSVAHLLVAAFDGVVSVEDHHHVSRVLRARPGELVTLTDGLGSWCSTIIPSEWTHPSIPLHISPAGIVTPGTTERPRHCVAFSLVKQDKPETVVQKLTELGISRIVLLEADRSVVRWEGERASKHLARLQAVSREALGQSRGVWLPTLSGPVSPARFLADELAAGREVAAAALPGPRSDSGPTNSGPTDSGPTDSGPGSSSRWSSVASVLIGPEGGWSSAELTAFGHHTVMFGDSVLRAETAAIAAGVLLAMQHLT
jgi:16S rRNA (uracil1498-N3)-methyltransferase